MEGAEELCGPPVVALRPRKINVLFQVLALVRFSQNPAKTRTKNKLFCNFSACAHPILKNFGLETEHIFYEA